MEERLFLLFYIYYRKHFLEAALKCKRLDARLPPLESRVRVSVIPWGRIYGGGAKGTETPPKKQINKKIKSKNK